MNHTILDQWLCQDGEVFAVRVSHGSGRTVPVEIDLHRRRRLLAGDGHLAEKGRVFDRQPNALLGELPDRDLARDVWKFAIADVEDIFSRLQIVEMQDPGSLTVRNRRIGDRRAALAIEYPRTFEEFRREHALFLRWLAVADQPIGKIGEI